MHRKSLISEITMNPPPISRILASVILTVVALFATKSLWLKEGVSVQFDYEVQKDLSVQLFYCPAPDIPFTEGASIKKRIKKGKGNVSVFIPTGSKIARFRLDTGSEPEKFEFSNLQIVGRERADLDLSRFTTKNIQSYCVENEKACVISTHRDPYLTYQSPLSIEGKKQIRWTSCVVILLSSVCFAFVLGDMWKSRHTRPIEKLPKLKNVEFLRVLFTFFVLVTHFFNCFKIWNSGGQAVQFFFLLSGYLLAVTYRPDRKILDIAVNRYIRFVPLVVFGGLLAGGGWKSFQGLWMLQNMGLGIGDVPNAPAWYIAVLFWCTLFFVGLMKVFDKKQLLVILAVIAFAAMIMNIHCPYKANAPAPDRLPMYGVFTRGLLRGLSCMSIGILLAHICRRVQVEYVNTAQKLVYTAAELAILIYIIWGCFNSSVFSHYYVIHVLSHVVLLYLFVVKRGYISGVLESDSMAKLAKYSLSIYLTHWMFMRTVRRYMEQEFPGWLQDHIALSITLGIVGSCIVGVLAHHLVEKPCTRYLTNFINWMKEGVVNKVH